MEGARGKFVLWGMLAVMSSGCATQATLTLHADPEGAYIIDAQGQSRGMAPVTVGYDLAKVSPMSGTSNCYLVKGFKAQWVSGATTTIDPIKLCGGKLAAYNLTLSRNLAAPGMEKDLQYAGQVEEMRARKEYADRERWERTSRSLDKIIGVGVRALSK